MDLHKLTFKELLLLQSSAIEELQRRGVVRTKNNPVGDFTEWLVANALDLELAVNSSSGYDATGTDGTRIQIKGRRITPNNKSRQLSAIRKLEEKDFDFLAGVIFNDMYEVIDAVLIPHVVIGEYATYRQHVNAHILHLRGKILEDTRVKDIKSVVCNVINSSS